MIKVNVPCPVCGGDKVEVLTEPHGWREIDYKVMWKCAFCGNVLPMEEWIKQKRSE